MGVFTAACGLSLVAEGGGSSLAVRGLLTVVASLVVPRLSRAQVSEVEARGSRALAQ